MGCSFFLSLLSFSFSKLTVVGLFNGIKGLEMGQMSVIVQAVIRSVAVNGTVAMYFACNGVGSVMLDEIHEFRTGDSYPSCAPHQQRRCQIGIRQFAEDLVNVTVLKNVGLTPVEKAFLAWLKTPWTELIKSGYQRLQAQLYRLPDLLPFFGTAMVSWSRHQQI